MIKKLKIFFFFCMALLCGMPLFAQSEKTDKCDKNEHFADPILYDYLGTITGYLKDAALTGSDFKDAPGPLPKTGLKSVAGGLKFSDLKNVSGLARPSSSGKHYENSIGKIANIKSDLSVGKGLPKNINKALNKEGVRFNPLAYKVKFAGETGRIDSVVIPLGLSASAETFRNYKFVHILLESDKYESFVKNLEKKVFFKFAGERKIFDRFGKTREIVILGWVPINGFNFIYETPNVLRVAIEDSRAEFPAMTKISFILKLPRQVASNLFISSFLRDIGRKNGFRLDEINPLENSFGIVNVTGKAPIDNISDIFSSPFVLQIKQSI